MDRIKEFIQDILENNTKRYIAIGIISALTLTKFLLLLLLQPVKVDLVKKLSLNILVQIVVNIAVIHMIKYIQIKQ